jgi:Lrp/AsnC family leucine-responsive transcriptional regulator
MGADRNIDSIDDHILELLQDNARVSQVDVARAVGLAPSAVLERIRKLESRRVIKGYAALLDAEALDRRMLAFVSVRTTDRPGEARVGQALALVPEVLEVHHVAGDDCLLLKIRARDAAHLSQILRERLGSIDGIRSTRTTIVLETVKEDPRLPLRISGAAGDQVPS